MAEPGEKLRHDVERRHNVASTNRRWRRVQGCVSSGCGRDEPLDLAGDLFQGVPCGGEVGQREVEDRHGAVRGREPTQLEVEHVGRTAAGAADDQRRAANVSVHAQDVRVAVVGERVLEQLA